MAYTGRAPSQAPITSADINDGVVTPADLSTGAPSWDASGNVSLDGAVVINESGADVDFRIESDTNANAFFLEGSSGNVGIGTSSPSTTLDVAGTITSTKLEVVTGTPVIDFIDTGAANIESRINGESRKLTYISDLAGVGGGEHIFKNGSTEAMRIDSNGSLLVGKTTTSTATVGAALVYNGQLRATVDGDVCAYLNRETSDGTIIDFRKDNTTVGSIGTQGSSIYIAHTSTGIRFYSNGIYPADGSGNTVDNSKDIGFSSVRFDDIYATNGTIQTSDRNEKQDIEELSEAETRAAIAAKGLLKKFRWKDAVAEKGDEARIHFGIIAQDLQAAFEAEGLDAGRYGMFIHSTWWETYTDVPAVEAKDAVLDDEGNVIEEAVEAKEAYTRTDTHDEPVEGATEKSRMGIRYPELLAFIIAAI